MMRTGNNSHERQITPNKHSARWAVAVLLIMLVGGSMAAQNRGEEKADHVETIVVIRHGEKPHGGFGQLSCEGLNRALALPKVLLGKYGKPNFVFAPNPSVQMRDSGEIYTYVRPLATIEPVAVEAGLPVNVLIGFNDIKALQKEVTSPRYADAVVFIAWEHVFAQRFAENMMSAFGGDVRQVPEWKGGDFDSIYVLRLKRAGEKTTISFAHEQEGLDGKLPKSCPIAPQPK